MDFLNFQQTIDILTIIIPSLISIVSVFIAIKSVKLTQRSIEDTNRPYVFCYAAYVDVGYLQKYLVIKNFGSTPAVITNIETDRKVIEFEENRELKSIINSTIAPDQKFVTVIPIKSKEKYLFTITYKEPSGKVTKQSFDINFGFTSDLRHVTQSSNQLTKDTNEIRAALHSQAKSNL